VILFALYLFAVTSTDPTFLEKQMKHERVRAAFSEKNETIRSQLAKAGLSADDLYVLFVAYKDEDQLELFVKKKSDDAYRLLTSYEVCARSGKLGPKRRQGDNQVPEGFYHIDRFNPQSNFHLSLGLNYPNALDQIKATSKDPGGEIFIHGACVTIGCLPMTDEKIKEIYAYAVYARNNGQGNIPVYIFPFRMTDENMDRYSTSFRNNSSVVQFWQNIRPGFEKFKKSKKELRVTVDFNGRYVYE
jgi:murein L,D-transpeptidase YafK